jgi:hypothetical protein
MADSVPHVKNSTFLAWMYSEMGAGLALLGLGDLAVKSSEHALQLVENTHEPYNEGYFRNSEHLNILVMLRDIERLKQFMDSPRRETARGYLRRSPHLFPGQVGLIRALYLLGDDAEADRERLWLDSHITAYGAESFRPNWDELIPVSGHSHTAMRS